MITEGKVVCKDGVEADITGDTICVHGDNPSAVMLVKKIRDTLLAAGIEIAPVGTSL